MVPAAPLDAPRLIDRADALQRGATGSTVVTLVQAVVPPTHTAMGVASFTRSGVVPGAPTRTRDALWVEHCTPAIVVTRATTW